MIIIVRFLFFLDLDEANLAAEFLRPFVCGYQAENRVFDELPSVPRPIEAEHEGRMLWELVVPPGNHALSANSNSLSQHDDAVSVESRVGPTRGQYVAPPSGGPGFNPQPDQVAAGALTDHQSPHLGLQGGFKLLLLLLAHGRAIG